MKNTPEAHQRRETVGLLNSRGVSVRRGCALTGLARSSYYYHAHPRDDSFTCARLAAIAEQRKRFGYRRAHALLVRDGEVINKKRVHRLWRELGLQLPRKRPRKKRVRRDPIPMLAECPDHVWTYDFLFDAQDKGRRLKILTLEDEFTREGLAIEVDHSIKSRDLICVLADLLGKRGPPMYIRSDNGPEFIASNLKKWLNQKGTDTIHIEPGRPWQNGFIESFNSRLRDEFLNMEVFYSLREAQVKAEMWRRDYNEDRPHSSLSYQTPVEYREAFLGALPPNPQSLTLFGPPTGQ